MPSVANATLSGSLADSLDVVTSSARIVREFEGVMTQAVDRITLRENIGITWREVDLAKLTAQDITESTVLDNPQKIADTLFQVTPTVIGIHTVITDRVRMRVSSETLAQMGRLAQNAIERLKSQRGHSILSSASTDLGNTSNPLLSAFIAAGVARIRGNSNEPGMPPFQVVLHPFGVHDIWSEIVTGVMPEHQTANRVVGATPTDPNSISATRPGDAGSIFQNGFRGNVAGAAIMEDGLLSTSSNNSTGGVFAKEGIVLVQGFAPRTYTERMNSLGGGAEVLYIYDEFAYGERSSGNWVFGLSHDATAPTG
tara:strand:+ start:11278 stop:12213 length:936 start_codon:yes stop_codon:yes gene_type:complete